MGPPATSLEQTVLPHCLNLKKKKMKTKGLFGDRDLIWDCSLSRVTLSVFTWKPADKNDLKRTHGCASRTCLWRTTQVTVLERRRH